MEKPSKLWTKREVARFLRVRPERIDVLIRDCGFPAIFLPKAGGKGDTLRFSHSSIQAWVRSREEFLPE